MAMVAYIQRFIDEMTHLLHFGEWNDIGARYTVLREELDRLDPRDFPPDLQFDFVQARMQIRRIASKGEGEWESNAETKGAYVNEVQRIELLKVRGPVPPMTEKSAAKWDDQLAGLRDRLKSIDDYIDDRIKGLDEISKLLTDYGGVGAGRTIRKFPFITSIELRDIVERDYRELGVQLLPSAAWKSAVVLAGSIVEAVLYDQLTRDSVRTNDAMSSRLAPKKNRGTVARDITSDRGEDKWTLEDLIKVSVDLNILPQARADTIDQVLRDYRNFVHPRKEIRSGHPCSEAEATLAKGALDAVINHLSP